MGNDKIFNNELVIHGLCCHTSSKRLTNKPLLIEKLGVKISKLDQKSEKTERVNRSKITQNWLQKMHCKRIIKTEKDLQIRKRIKNWSLSFPVYTQLKMIQNHLLSSNGHLAPIYFVLEICYFFSWNTCLLWAFYNNVSISKHFFCL